MAFFLRGLGLATPANRLSLDEAIRLTHTVCCETDAQRRIASVLYRRAQVDGRSTSVTAAEVLDASVDPRGPSLGARMQWFEERCAPLALESAEQALESAAVRPADVTHLVTVSCTGFEAPGVDIALMRGLGLPRGVQRVHVGFMGCHGAVNGLRAARGLAESQPDANVLLVATELCSLHYASQWNTERIAGNALFADGSGALVGGATPRADHDWRLAATGSCLFPDTDALLSWRVRDHGFEMGLSPELPAAIEHSLHDWLAGWLAEQGTTIADVASWAIHPGGPRILAACRTALGLPEASTAAAEAVLRDHGNMSSATLLFVLQRLQAAGAKPPCVMLGFGPGVVAEAALWV